MRVALIVPGGVDRSGEVRVIPALLAYIKRLSRDHEVEVIALLQEPHPGSWTLFGATVHNIGTPNTGWRGLRTVLRLHRGRPFDVVHAFWSGTSGLIASLAGHYGRIPNLIHLAGGELAAIPEIGYGAALTWRGRVREPCILRSVTMVTAASAPVLESLAGHGIRARRVPLGVDLDSWPPRSPRRRDLTRPIRLIHVASLNAVKDQTTLLRALGALKEERVPFSLEVVGEDTLHGRIQALAAGSGLSEHVRFRGFMTQRRLRPLMEDADLLIHTSLHETGPLVVLEAAAAGVPTVGTAVGHIAEWAPAAALAAPVGDAPGLAALLRSLIDHEDLRLTLAHEAQRRAIAEDADYTARTFINLYQTLRAP